MDKKIKYIDKEINMINNIIFQAIKHGADSGGSYYSNEEELISSINNWINYNNLENEYCVNKIDIETVEYGWGHLYPDIPQIIKK